MLQNLQNTSKILEFLIKENTSLLVQIYLPAEEAAAVLETPSMLPLWQQLATYYHILHAVLKM